MSTIGRRLTALERSGDKALGLRVFYQTLEDGNVFFDNDDGPAYTTAQIHELAVAGWQILKVVYVSDWRPTGAALE
jgi:hypothetical protein